jgi:antitoxin (DNA-binding transcriptional repressor) of toxin-antitoxin stability system
MVFKIDHNYNMMVSIAEAKTQLPKLVRAVEAGETVVITRHGKPVARLETPQPEPGEVILGGLKDRIKLYPGWDAPVDVEGLLSGEL